MSYFLLSFLQADKREDQMSNLQVELQTLKNDKTKDLLAQEIQNLKNEKNAANSRYEKEKETEKNRRQADQDRIKELISEVEKTKSAGEASRGGNSLEISLLKSKLNEAEAASRASELEREKAGQRGEQSAQELQEVLEARDSFCERVLKGIMLSGIELEIYNTLAVSRERKRFEV